MQPVAWMIDMVCIEYGDALVTRDKEGVRFGSLVKSLRDHWMVCPNCPVWGFETQKWTWGGDGCPLGSVEVALTGWEMLGRFEEYAMLKSHQRRVG